MQRIDFTNFRKYYKQASIQIPADDFYQDFITHKVVHSMQVLKYGRKILAQTPELADKSSDFTAAAERALLFHDVGRFEEGVLRYKAEKENQNIAAASLAINHGDLGYETLLRNPHYNDPRILAAVKYHGAMLEDVYDMPQWKKFMLLPEKDDIKQILLLVRDADKLENLYTITNEHRLSQDIFYKQLTEDLRRAPLSAETIQQFFEGHVVRFRTVRSWSDRILMVLSWVHDINYETSKKICRRMKCFDYLLSELDKINTDKNMQKQIEEMIKFK